MVEALTVFAVVFVAELGDKTQLATVLFAADRDLHPVLVFAAAASALVLATGLAVLAGNVGARYLEAIPIKLIAGLGFMAIGMWSVIEHFRGA